MIDELGFAGAIMVGATALAGITVLVLMQIRFSREINLAEKHFNWANILLSWSLIAGFLAIILAFVWFDPDSTWTIADTSVWLGIAFTFFCVQLVAFIISAYLLRLLKFR